MQGLLLADKPAGMSSHDVVARWRRALGLKALGHAGTLDPNATGLLVLAVGKATRWLPYLPSDKRYRGRMRLGLATDTEDIWGQPVTTADASAVDAGQVRAALEGLLGLQSQVPPMVSALKKDGRRLYELAREGVELERAPRPVRIREIKVLGIEGAEAEFEVACSAGTYVRSLCVEAGRRLGLPACMSALRRLESGPFSVQDALPEGRWVKEEGLRNLLGADKALAHLPALEVDEPQAAALRQGRSIPCSSDPDGRVWRLQHAGGLVALAHAKDGRLQPERVFD